MTPLQQIARDGLASWLDLPPWPTAESIRLQQEAAIEAKPWDLLDAADEYQREAIATAQSEAAQEATRKEYE